MLLKANLHMHTSEDPEDSHLSYSVYGAVDFAKKCNFDVLALTCHQKFVYKKEHGEYASQKGILLIPGIEIAIKGKRLHFFKKHTVVLNCDEGAENIDTFQKLADYKKSHPQSFIIAAHPFFWPKSFSEKELRSNINLFDAIEFCWYYAREINFNKKAEKMAEEYKKPFIATSDTHFLQYLEKNYALIEAEKKDIASVLSAIKQGKFQNKSSPLKITKLISYQFMAIAKIFWNRLISI